MRSIIFFVGVAAALAAETSFESGIALVKDQLEQTMLNGQSHGAGLASGQKNMVLSMLSQMSGDPLSQPSQDAINSAIDLLKEIKTSLQSDRDSDTAVINGIVSSVDGECYPQSAVDELAAVESDAYLSATAHSTCRAAQNTTEKSKIDACDTDFEGYIQGAMQGELNCGNHIHDHQSLNHLETNDKLSAVAIFVGNTHSALQQRIGRYNELKGLCSSALTDQTNKRTECTNKMNDMIVDECAVHAKKAANCAAEAVCYAAREAEYTNAVNTRTAAGNQRWKDAMQLDVIICLLERIKLGETDLENTDYATCVHPVGQENDYKSDYQSSYNSFPDARACVEAGAADKPGGDSWHEIHMAPWGCPTSWSWCININDYNACQ